MGIRGPSQTLLLQQEGPLGEQASGLSARSLTFLVCVRGLPQANLHFDFDERHAHWPDHATRQESPQGGRQRDARRHGEAAVQEEVEAVKMAALEQDLQQLRLPCDQEVDVEEVDVDGHGASPGEQPDPALRHRRQEGQQQWQRRDEEGHGAGSAGRTVAREAALLQAAANLAPIQAAVCRPSQPGHCVEEALATWNLRQEQGEGGAEHEETQEGPSDQ
mmetsp:Transcript_126383/g.328141  ORF Transcript_126383/g.328141 Transcript_126383/m.328141 type:complete len:219 (-) Transcript_126383:751-1407(-)